MSHADVLVCDGYQQQETGPFFLNMKGSNSVDLLANVPTSRSTE